ncbi:MAG: anthranilate synthase component I [Calditrichaceae bacterium]|nr:anthranilate synthase component I [Calditrichaceae bacterium]MBN2707701.1 anthranilate synthase component I [Calditrichaceae bacterium]RQV96483.1 MAG: anthranilate synthase component I [Calditrichota bacterium]
MEFSQFKNLAAPGTIIPVFKKFNADFITPVMAYLKMKEKGKHSFLLESVISGDRIGRYSFLGQAPFLIQKYVNDKTLLVHGSRNQVREDNYFKVLKEQLHSYKMIEIPELPRFTCGAVGFIGYEMIGNIEKLPAPKTDIVGNDAALMAFYDHLVAFDHLKNEIILIANVFIDKDSNLEALYEEAMHRIDSVREKLNRPLNANLEFSVNWDTEKSNFKKEDYLKAVKTAKEYIFAGDIFQDVVSQRFSVEYSGEPFQVYRALRNINPSPYMFYLDFRDYQVIGSSPESLITALDSDLEIIPIAGTRRRGKNINEDEALAEELLNDPKELAEHVMLVDLARNDLGRISRYGSVKVHDFKTIQYYSHVIHIISRVTGKLKPELDAVDAFMSAFPAGTVSGAPKIRAMEIINELEPERRGIYAGAVGYFDYCGNMDMCIAIRTLVASKGKLFYQAGAGIVADSSPELEYKETMNKVKVLRKAAEEAAGGINDIIYR